MPDETVEMKSGHHQLYDPLDSCKCAIMMLTSTHVSLRIVNTAANEFEKVVGSTLPGIVQDEHKFNEYNAERHSNTKRPYQTVADCQLIVGFRWNLTRSHREFVGLLLVRTQ